HGRGAGAAGERAAGREVELRDGPVRAADRAGGADGGGAVRCDGPVGRLVPGARGPCAGGGVPAGGRGLPVERGSGLRAAADPEAGGPARVASAPEGADARRRGG